MVAARRTSLSSDNSYSDWTIVCYINIDFCHDRTKCRSGHIDLMNLDSTYKDITPYSPHVSFTYPAKTIKVDQILYIGNLSRPKILAKMSLGRLVKFSLSRIFAI